jgi:hypothetical protein
MRLRRRKEGETMQGKGIMELGMLRYVAGICIIAFSVLAICSCGYQMVQGKGIFGGDITSLSIPGFKNKTYEPHAPSYVTEAFSQELLSTGLFKLNKADSDGYLEGTIKSIRIIPYSMSTEGIVQEKVVYIDLDLALYRRNGVFVKRWTMGELEPYRVDDINAEDFNKRDAIRRMSARMARKFISVLLIDY